ncbi:hypothetical protein [Amycolatopsis panacis]|uniref:Uncharacterized protein n=1 Tax=Amycolatopsis panacis TaxID=2340917 RepID=A0A419HRS6_9PSEU|nr:hypothetical protein [Amycolatopsis panacis]RJQ79313.1 hypothetical protein D5S19_26510 [Amycolatopsis panacis]
MNASCTWRTSDGCASRPTAAVAGSVEQARGGEFRGAGGVRRIGDRDGRVQGEDADAHVAQLGPLRRTVRVGRRGGDAAPNTQPDGL